VHALRRRGRAAHGGALFGLRRRDVGAGELEKATSY
jgi:hypothetical protein